MTRVTPNASKNRRVALIAAVIGVGMVGASYAAVPFYKAFCQATGFGGTTQRATKAPDKATDKFITIRFDANTSSGLPWEFHARQTMIKVKIGEQNLAYYDAKNIGSNVFTGSAVYNVTPPVAGQYFDKIQCFCFTKHTLKPGEHDEFPVSFFVDPAILDSPDGRGIDEITLSYTFYPADAPEVTQKQAAN
jgi:cytochrome c oxidase assembly protein subunit 11